MQGPWQHVLEAMKVKGSDSGAKAASTVEQMMSQTQQAVRAGRASGLKAAQAMLDSYSALVSGVLIGMSEGLQSGSPTAAKTARKK
jgi:hypothetical protein